MSLQTENILGAADYAHQNIHLAKELLQEALGNTGQILTCGCMDLGPASLGSTMRLGQKLKEFSFLLDGLLKDAHGLCVLLGHDLGAIDDDVETLGDLVDSFPASDDLNCALAGLYEKELEPGKDEYNADGQPF